MAKRKRPIESVIIEYFTLGVNDSAVQAIWRAVQGDYGADSSEGNSVEEDATAEDDGNTGCCKSGCRCQRWRKWR